MSKVKGKFYRHVTSGGKLKSCIVLCTEDAKYATTFTGIVVRDDEKPDNVGTIADDFYSDVFQETNAKVSYGKLV